MLPFNSLRRHLFIKVYLAISVNLCHSELEPVTTFTSAEGTVCAMKTSDEPVIL